MWKNRKIQRIKNSEFYNSFKSWNSSFFFFFFSILYSSSSLFQLNANIFFTSQITEEKPFFRGVAPHTYDCFVRKFKVFKKRTFSVGILGHLSQNYFIMVDNIPFLLSACTHITQLYSMSYLTHVQCTKSICSYKGQSNNTPFCSAAKLDIRNSEAFVSLV